MDRTKFITREDQNPGWVFVFGDNTLRMGHGGAAALRTHPQTYGFITKRYPGRKASDYFTPEEYESIFEVEFAKLCTLIEANPHKQYIVSKLGSNLANRFGIYEAIIKDKLETLSTYLNVVLMKV